MRSNRILVILLLLTSISFSQKLTGVVYEKENEKLLPLTGVNIIWLGTTTGTTTDEHGDFTINLNKNSNKLIFSMVGFLSDTIEIAEQKSIEVILKPNPKKMDEVEVVKQKPTLFLDHRSIENKSVMTDKELFKAACCNLSESFETNPSIDVSFTDAITGTKQIEMLGLSGIYVQTTMENMPYLRGLLSNVGLTYIPGTWVKAINVSKGTGSVANGYESMTGQIDINLRNADDQEEQPLFANFYGDFEKRFEGNLNFKTNLSDDITGMTFLHYSQRKNRFDENMDSFLDIPTFQNFNLMQRWTLHLGNGWENRIGFHYVNDSKDGGSISANKPTFQYNTKTNNLELYAKMGYIFEEKPYQSFGFQFAFNNFNNSSKYGQKSYDGKEMTGYFNFIYQSIIDTIYHKFRTGVSFLYDQYDEKLDNRNFPRIERVPGAFFEYTYTYDENLSFILGARGDYHNQYGFMFTPRFHFRYSPAEEWVFRGVAGRGYRTSNILNEYSSVLASSRDINILQNNNYGFGLNQEKVWNYGLNVTHYFYIGYREVTLSVDFYRTDFETATIPDLDSNPQEVNFYSAEKGSYSNSLQVELNFKPIDRLDVRMAYRYLDVKQKIGGEFKDRPYNSKHRALLTLNYTTLKEEVDSPQMFYDLIIQWFGEKRIPSTKSNPTEYQNLEQSPSFFLVNLQVSRTLMQGLDFYIGVENIFDYRQKNLVISADNPESKYFDASMVWGPITGRMIYAGLRFGMN